MLWGMQLYNRPQPAPAMCYLVIALQLWQIVLFCYAALLGVTGLSMSCIIISSSALRSLSLSLSHVPNPVRYSIDYLAMQGCVLLSKWSVILSSVAFALVLSSGSVILSCKRVKTKNLRTNFFCCCLRVFASTILGVTRVCILVVQ